MINEILKKVHIQEFKDFYEVSNLGNVRSLKTSKKRILKQHIRCGYKAIAMEICNPQIKKTQNVHILVAYAFCKYPKKRH